MKTLAIGLSCVMALTTATAVVAEDSGKKITRTLDLSGFERLDVSGVYNLDVRVGPAFSVELSGTDYEMELVESSVKNGTLRLDQRDASRKEKRRWRNNRDGVKAVITLPMLTGLDISGVVDGAIVDISAENFDVDISGVGEIDLDGSCGRLNARVSGVGELDADALECRIVDIRLSGVGDASVFASEEIDAHVSGMGDIDVFGSPPKVSKSNSMFADITVH